MQILWPHPRPALADPDGRKAEPGINKAAWDSSLGEALVLVEVLEVS
jgi:hypothetical protein